MHVCLHVSCLTEQHFSQLSVTLVVLCQIIYHFMPPTSGLWIMFALIICQGFLGGMVYGNVFLRIREEVCTYLLPWASYIVQ